MFWFQVLGFKNLGLVARGGMRHHARVNVQKARPYHAVGRILVPPIRNKEEKVYERDVPKGRLGADIGRPCTLPPAPLLRASPPPRPQTCASPRPRVRYYDVEQCM